MRDLLSKLDIELVFTAHPTEAKRRTGGNTLGRLRTDLVELNRADLLSLSATLVLRSTRGGGSSSPMLR